MRCHLLCLLMMTILASSLSNSVPILSINRAYQRDVNNQKTDNTESRFYTRNLIYSLFCNPRQDSVDLQKLCFHFSDNYDDVSMEKDDNYNGEGYRKEQWHNYPRQLDRLQNYLYERHKPDDFKRAVDDNTDNYEIEHETLQHSDTETNEITNGNDDTQTSQTSVEKILILQIPPNDDVTDKDIEMMLSELDSRQGGTNEQIPEGSDLDPAIKMLKIKRESSAIEGETVASGMQQANSRDSDVTVKKRLFSLWSRLQSLSHKGHELHHRRHLHAFYGMEDGGAGGVLTAETRALMRPPGSPLRWG